MLPELRNPENPRICRVQSARSVSRTLFVALELIHPSPSRSVCACSIKPVEPEYKVSKEKPQNQMRCFITPLTGPGCQCRIKCLRTKREALCFLVLSKFTHQLSQGPLKMPDPYPDNAWARCLSTLWKKIGQF